ncbi:unnamed protein product [Effrenium voratum]|nr:unnamed protein product [Effrenium voratum]
MAAKMWLAPAAALGLAHVVFHWWIWSWQFEAFPSFRGTYPAPWRTLRAHWLTLQRLFRFATSPIRRLPDFYIIGAPKAGTSALYSYLSLHPAVKEPFMKESRFLSGMCGSRLSGLLYRSLFPTWWGSRGCLTFDSDATASLQPALAAAMYKQLTPNAKIILSCREPCSGVFSMYKMRSRIKGRGEHHLSFRDMYDLEMGLSTSVEWQNLEDLAAALDRNESVAITLGLARCVLCSSMIRGFHYADILLEFYRRFKPENVLIIRFKDLAADTESTVRRIFSFLDLPDIPLPDLTTIQPQDVMDIALEEEAQTAELSQADRSLLEAYFQVRNQDFAKLMGKPLEELW